MKKPPVLFYSEGACSLAPLIALSWLDQPFKVCQLRGRDSSNENYLKLNEMGEVPTLFMDGTILTENIAILLHIAQLDLSKKIGFPPGTREYDQLNRALGYLTSTFHKAFSPLFAPAAYHPDKKVQEEIAQTVVEGHLRDVFAYTSKHLLRTTLMFEQPTIADAYLYAMARWGKHFGNLEQEFPHIVRFQRRMDLDPGVEFAVQIEEGIIKNPIGNFWGHVDFKTFIEEAAHRKMEVDGARGEGEYTPDPDLTVYNRKVGAESRAASRP